MNGVNSIIFAKRNQNRKEGTEGANISERREFNYIREKKSRHGVSRA